MKKYLIGDSDSEKVEMTIDELKEKILSYKDPEPDEKLPERDGCCICLRRINSWFHGSGRVCSPECNLIFNQIFDIKNNPEKSIFDKLRRDLWIARGWQIPTTKWSDIKWESQ
jgi:hypothetical protein